MEFGPIPLTRLHPFFQNNWFGRLFHKGLSSLTNLLPGLFAYQLVARLQIIDKERRI